ncbi:MAG TPA: hypothetical protein VHX65_19730 [Pirellulales bacterium]|nr:hypothetical protein [Pirellulales bacterium]
MQLSELRKRDRLTRGVATFRGDEGLVPDSRGGLRPVDCIERKLGTLLTEEVAVAPTRFTRSSGLGNDGRPSRKTPE